MSSATAFDGMTCTPVPLRQALDKPLLELAAFKLRWA